MAVDQLLLEESVRDGLATMRLYRWQEPTLSLGYFQAYSERQSHAASRTAAIVRRQSGGGAILHDRELTYSLAVPPEHPAAAEPALIYDRVHTVLLRILQDLVTDAHRFVLSAQKSPTQPFLCFQRRAIGDIVYLAASRRGKSADNYKMVGSAQRRWRGAVLQHGSILLRASLAAPELPGIEDLTDCELDISALQVEFAQRAVEALELQERTSTGDEVRDWYSQNVSRIERLCETRYGNRLWTERR